MANRLDSPFHLEGKKIWVAGHCGMVGSAIVRRLGDENVEILTTDRSRVDLRSQSQVENWMSANKPDVVFIAAAKVGGILANSKYPADFLYDNLMIEANIIHSAFKTEIEKLLFLGSSCIYPKLAPQPMTEDALLTGPLEPTNEWYAVAKIAGIKLCQAYRQQHGCDFVSAMPTNLYGPGDNFNLETSHVVPALIRKAHDAQKMGHSEIKIWGTGTPRREFLHVDDAADAMVFLVKHYSDERHINVGTGADVSIADLVDAICKVVGYQGSKVYDSTKPDGAPRKLMDVNRLTEMGWTAQIGLIEGLSDAYQWYLNNLQNVRL